VNEPKNRHIRPEVLSRTSDASVLEGNRTSWRRDPAYFTAGHQLSPGITDIASCWFQAGHSVSPFLPHI
jgi:hypothetical protein